MTNGELIEKLKKYPLDKQAVCRDLGDGWSNITEVENRKKAITIIFDDSKKLELGS